MCGVWCIPVCVCAHIPHADNIHMACATSVARAVDARLARRGGPTPFLPRAQPCLGSRAPRSRRGCHCILQAQWWPSVKVTSLPSGCCQAPTARPPRLPAPHAATTRRARSRTAAHRQLPPMGVGLSAPLPCCAYTLQMARRPQCTRSGTPSSRATRAATRTSAHIRSLRRPRFAVAGEGATEESRASHDPTWRRVCSQRMCGHPFTRAH